MSEEERKYFREHKRKWRKENPILVKQQSKRQHKSRKRRGYIRPKSEITKKKNLERSIKWNRENKERVNELARIRYRKKRDKELKTYYSKLQYERRNKGRHSRWYYENREAAIRHKQEWMQIPGNREKHNERVRQWRKRKREQRQHLQVAKDKG